MQRQTTIAKAQDIERKWFVIDATDLPLGRLASEIAVRLTGNKEETKKYYNHSGYLGHLRVRTAGTMKKEYPVEMIERVVWGMLPKGRLGRQMVKKLFVYEGPDHKHEAQKPQAFDVKF